MEDNPMTTASKYILKSNEQEAGEHLRAFLAGSSLGRPALHVTVANPYFVGKTFRPEGFHRKNVIMTRSGMPYARKRS
jgi:hypothetical protein